MATTFFKSKSTEQDIHRQRSFVYVALGDSTVEGVGASDPSNAYSALIFKHLRSIYPEVNFHNLGKRGAKTRDVLEKQVDRAVGLQPDLITLTVGVNDLRFGITIRTFSKQYKLILQKLVFETNAVIVVTTIPDFSEIPAMPKLLKRLSIIAIRRYNAEIVQITKGLHVQRVDLFPKKGKYLKLYPQTVSSDGFHPSDIGYALWASAILSQIQRLHITGSYGE